MESYNDQLLARYQSHQQDFAFIMRLENALIIFVSDFYLVQGEVSAPLTESFAY
jgi:chromosome condensin MukBEF complex kleisin-like MukF subunit